MRKEYAELKQDAIDRAKSQGHELSTWDEGGKISFGTKWIDYGSAKCVYCNQKVIVDTPRQAISLPENQCLSIGRTVNPEGLAATTWEYCRECSKKINPRNTKEVLSGIHGKCRHDKYHGTVALDIHDNQLTLWVHKFA